MTAERDVKAISLPYDDADENVRRYLTVLASRIGSRPARVADVLTGVATATPVLLTFDDRGQSACGRVAELLEAFGWRGHFFVTPGFIGAPGFLAADQIRSLTRRGHLIGIHVSRADRSSESGEWEHGARILNDILRVPVWLGSVSGGYDARPAAAAAAAAGLQVLFTSDPTPPKRVDGCLVLGRYVIDGATAPRTAAACATGSGLPWVRRRVAWNCLKLARALGV